MNEISTCRSADLLSVRARAESYRVLLGEENELETCLARLYELQVRRGGWGLEYAWDAFSDGSVNPAHTVYGYTTAHAALAYEAGWSVTGNHAYLRQAWRAAHTLLFLSELDRRGRFVWYSDQPCDQQSGYEVLNIGGLALFVFARLDVYNRAQQELSRFLLSFQRQDGAFPYMLRDERVNDLFHEMLIVQGLLASGFLPAASASLVRARRAHFNVDGSPKDDSLTRGWESCGWGAPALLYTMAGVPAFEMCARLVYDRLSESYDPALRTSTLASSDLAHAWYDLAITKCRYLLSGGGEGL